MGNLGILSKKEENRVFGVSEWGKGASWENWGIVGKRISEFMGRVTDFIKKLCVF